MLCKCTISGFIFNSSLDIFEYMQTDNILFGKNPLNTLNKDFVLNDLIFRPFIQLKESCDHIRQSSISTPFFNMSRM